EIDVAPFDLAGLANEAHQGQGDGRLTGAGLAHESEPLLWHQIEADAIHGAHRTRRGVIRNPQVLDPQELSCHQTRRRRRGLASSSSPTAIKNSPVNSTMIMMIGGSHHHHHELMIAA